MSSALADTLKRLPEAEHEEGDADKQPGIVLVYAGREPLCRAMPLPEGTTELGRINPELEPELSRDPLVSRRHAQLVRQGAAVYLTDQGSRNGSRVDGEPLTAGSPRQVTRYFRIGDSLFILVADVRSFCELGIRETAGQILGPAMQGVLGAVSRAARHGEILHITGASGVGKELCARAFHQARPSERGSFVAVNCATIPESIAERLLFGAKRGAFSGADADADGYVQSADGGTLFLDEIGDLHASVQAKLLRLLENHEVLPVGASRPRTVKLHVCSATHKDLRAQVAAGRLREDLYFRIGKPAVAVPALRERIEEIPWLVHRAARQADKELVVSASFIEQCLGRPWPGNVRELLVEARTAVQSALEGGSRTLEARHLGRTAGTGFVADAASPGPASASGSAPDREQPDREQIQQALAQSQGNVSAAARLLGVHRTQLYRWMSRHGLEPGDKAPRRP